VTKHSGPRWREELHRHGYTHIVSSYEQVTTGPRRYGLLLAARSPLLLLDLSRHNIPWPERLLGAEVQLPGQTLLYWFNTHIPPGSSNGWVKVEMLEAVQRVALAHKGSPVLLCGDLNCPQEERLEGVVTWAQTIRPDGSVRTKKTIRGQPAQRWDDAERTLTGTPEVLGLRDAVRACLPLPDPQHSWVLHRKGTETRRRFDHVFVGGGVQPVEAEYLHNLRTAGLSDHAAVLMRMAML
jgi:endonuclease/exonuclease/phosphatase family metal-dependent hydrolase